MSRVYEALKRAAEKRTAEETEHDAPEARDTQSSSREAANNAAPQFPPMSAPPTSSVKSSAFDEAMLDEVSKSSPTVAAFSKHLAALHNHNGNGAHDANGNGTNGTYNAHGGSLFNNNNYQPATTPPGVEELEDLITTARETVPPPDAAAAQLNQPLVSNEEIVDEVKALPTYDEIARDGNVGTSRYFNFNEQIAANDSPAAEQLFLHAEEANNLSLGFASNEQNDNRVGAALHDAQGSRSAGATLDARGSTPVGFRYPSVDIEPSRVEPHLITVTDARSPLVEQYRALRTRVMQAAESKRMQVFVVSSVNPAEGKTVSSLNLAWLLAQSSGVRALLIDGDLRRPCTSEYLGLDENIKGLSEILDGRATLQETVIELQPAGLHLLPGGTPREDVADLLSGARFKQLLIEARCQFDYIIIDAPPLGIFTDATMLMNLADGALLVVRSGRVRYATLNRLISTLPQERILGIVLNGSEEQVSDNRTYYYQKKYHKGAQTVVTEVEDPTIAAAQS